MGGMGTGNPVPNSMPGQINPQQASGPLGFMQNMIFNRLYNSNPQFKQFADSMQGMTPEQAFQQQGLDYNQYKNMTPEQIMRMAGFNN